MLILSKNAIDLTPSLRFAKVPEHLCRYHSGVACKQILLVNIKTGEQVERGGLEVLRHQHFHGNPDPNLQSYIVPPGEPIARLGGIGYGVKRGYVIHGRSVQVLIEKKAKLADSEG